MADQDDWEKIDWGTMPTTETAQQEDPFSVLDHRTCKQCGESFPPKEMATKSYCRECALTYKLASSWWDESMVREYYKRAGEYPRGRKNRISGKKPGWWKV